MSAASRRPETSAGKRWRAAFFALAAAGVLAAVAWALLGSKLLVVRSVTVTGTHLVPSSEVTGVADVPRGTPLGRVDTVAVARRVEAIRQVASATVTKSWPDRLTITVRERVPVVAVRMADGRYDLVDRSGVIVRWTPAKPPALPVYLATVRGDELRADRGLANAGAVLAELPPWLSRKVTTVTSSVPVTLRLRDGRTVVWGDVGRAAVKGRELAILIRGGARYIDVSAPGTAVTN